MNRNEIELKEMLADLSPWDLLIVIVAIRILFIRRWLRRHGLWIG